MDRELLSSEIKQAMRDKDKARISILRMVKNEIDAKEKASGEDLSPEDVVATLKKVLKQTTETLEASQKAATDDERTAGLQVQVDILSGYLPEQVTWDALASIVDRVIADEGFTEKRDMGRAIGMVVAETGGNCDKAEVAKLIAPKLN